MGRTVFIALLLFSDIAALERRSEATFLRMLPQATNCGFTENAVQFVLRN